MPKLKSFVTYLQLLEAIRDEQFAECIAVDVTVLCLHDIITAFHND